jgi:hypothetical protein
MVTKSHLILKILKINLDKYFVIWLQYDDNHVR